MRRHDLWDFLSKHGHNLREDMIFRVEFNLDDYVVWHYVTDGNNQIMKDQDRRPKIKTTRIPYE